MNLDTTCTQAQFGELVGISQPAVSDLLTREVIQPGATAGAWLIDYCAHLREQAAGRGADDAVRGPVVVIVFSEDDMQHYLDAVSELRAAGIAAELYLTPKTVEYHLGNIYAKLGINSRHQLAVVFDR